MEKRKIVAVILGIVILIMSVFVYINREEWFNTTVTLTYADGCSEVYVNNVLTTPICENGRAIEKMREGIQSQKTPSILVMPALT